MGMDAPAVPERSLITERFVAMGQLAVQMCPWYFDFPAYLGETEVRKKVRILNAVEAAIAWIGTIHGWQLQAFEALRTP